MAGVDRGLIDALRAPDDAAFATSVALHLPGFVRVARVSATNAHAPRDVVEATWRGLGSLDRLDDRSAPPPWPLAMAALSLGGDVRVGSVPSGGSARRPRR